MLVSLHVVFRFNTPPVAKFFGDSVDLSRSNDMILSLFCVAAGTLTTPIQAANDTATQAAPTRRHRQRTQRSNDTALPTALFTFAVMGDTHVWLPSAARDEYQRSSDGASERDGLLVDSSPALLRQQYLVLSEFAASGGSFAIHSGDAVCGGGSFTKASGEYERSLEAVVTEQRAALGRWPVFYASGNHDVDPTDGGLAKWRRLLGGSGMGDAGTSAAVGYRAVRLAPGWRLLLLDGMDDVPHDADGHGHMGEAQLAWLSRELDESAAESEQVILVVHQLLVAPLPDLQVPFPSSSSTELPAWLDWRADFVDNREEVLELLARHSHVRVSFHGHVHANTEARRHGITFVSSAAVGEYPMTWREVAIYPCEMVISIRTLGAPLDLLEKSRLRDTRAGRNEIKVGGSTVTKVPLQCVSAERMLAAAAAGGRTVPVPLARRQTRTAAIRAARHRHRR